MGRRASIAAVFAMVLASSGCSEPSLPFSGRVFTAEAHPPFPIGSDSPHRNISCDTCHGAFESFTQFDCGNCHEEHSRARMDTVHAGINGYRHVSADCVACHPDGLRAARLSAETHRSFSILPGSRHSGVFCSECHADGVDSGRTNCQVCHHALSAGLDDSHAGVGGYEPTVSAGCMLCHSRGLVPVTLTQHNTFFLLPEYHRHCTSCHTQVDKSFPFPAATFGSNFDCFGTCHEHGEKGMQETHANVPDYSYESCYDCHGA